MRVRILRAVDHRISSALTQAFAAGSIVNVPRATAMSLIARNAATPHRCGIPKPATKEHHNGHGQTDNAADHPAGQRRDAD